jgi:glycosyltransferase involved in cell wall biosynthesis
MKLNILHITPDFNYACGRSYYVFQLLKYFKHKKHNVLLVTNGGDSLDRLEDYGIPYILLKNLRSKNIISFLKNVNYIRELIRGHDIGIIHTYHRYSELLAVQAAKLKGIKKVKTVSTSLSLVKRKYNIEFKSDKIIAVSGTIKNMLTEKFKVPEHKISVIHNFTDTEEINELEVLSHNNWKDHGDTYNILSIGRFHHEKNFEVLLKAINLLKDRKIKLILVGEGDKNTDYTNYINRHHLNVEIIVPQKKLLAYFLVADLCVLPSARDPFPNFMLQSGLHKKPFIGANVDGIGEIIEEGVNGLLFESGNAQGLAEKINMFRRNSDLSKKCASQLYGDVINNYTQEFIAPKIEKLYRELEH